MGINPDPFDMDERVKNYLMKKGERGFEDPQYMYGKGAIETAGLQGIAGGMAQMGTVHGKTPSVQPYVDSSSKALGGLQSLAKEPLIDPQVMEYIMSRTKHPENPVRGKATAWSKAQVTPSGDQTWSRTKENGDLETKIEGKAHMAPPPGSTPKQPGLTENKQQGIFKQGVLSEKQYQDATTGEQGWDPTKQFQLIDSSNLGFLKQFKTPKAQQAHAAMDAWVETFLRDASGAAIGPAERPAYFGIYFPQGGDTPQTVEQKKQQRMEKVKTAAHSGLITPDEYNNYISQMGVGSSPQKKPLTPEEKKELETLRNRKAGVK